MDNVDMHKHKESINAAEKEMRLGKLGFAAMNNPIRRWFQKHVEFRIFKKTSR